MTCLAPLDPQIQEIVSAWRHKGAPRVFSGDIEEARERLAKSVKANQCDAEMPTVGKIERIMVGAVPVRIYRPASAGIGATVVWLHGGGYALGSLDVFDETARQLCHELDSVIVAVGYRRPPEHPFPTPFKDAVDVTLWAQEHAGDLGGSRTCVAVAGESAGGNLAASTAIMLRDRGIDLAGQLLIVPGVNLARDLPVDAVFPMLHAADLVQTRDILMGQDANVATFPPSPFYADDLRKLPPAVVVVAGHDPLRAEGVAYAQLLAEAGVDTKLLTFDTMHHTFFGFARASEGARKSIKTLCTVFRNRLISQISNNSPGADNEIRR